PPCTPRPGAPSSPRGRVSRASTWWRRPGRSRTIRTSPTSDSPATRRAPPGRWDRCGWCGSGRTGLGTARSPSGRCGRASRRCGSRGTAGASTDPPAVRTVRPERPDSGWIQWISEIEPDPRRDLRVLMALRHLSVQLWSDPVDLAPVLQLTIEEARRAVQQLLDHHLRGHPLIHEIEGVPSAAPMPSVAVDSAALEALATLRRGGWSGGPAPEPRAGCALVRAFTRTDQHHGTGKHRRCGADEPRACTAKPRARWSHRTVTAESPRARVLLSLCRR